MAPQDTPPTQTSPPAVAKLTPPQGKLRPATGPRLAGTSQSLSLGVRAETDPGKEWEWGEMWPGLWACAHTCAHWITFHRRTPARKVPAPCTCSYLRSLAGCPLSGGGLPGPSTSRLGIQGPTHFIFSVRCSVFSRMAWDSWDTGFSIRLSKMSCENRASARCPGVPPESPAPSAPPPPAQVN